MPGKAHCDYYNLPVRVIEDPEFAFTCELMNRGECSSDCRHFNAAPSAARGVPHGC
jgi:hypothetical protein